MEEGSGARDFLSTPAVCGCVELKGKRVVPFRRMTETDQLEYQHKAGICEIRDFNNSIEDFTLDRFCLEANA